MEAGTTGCRSTCRAFFFLCVGLLLTELAVTAHGHATPCNQGNDTLCLQGVREYLTSTDWWFGDSFSVECPSEKLNTEFRCLNPRPQFKTIIERLLQRSDFDVNNIEQFLRIRYSHPGGTGRACGHQFVVPPVRMTKDLDNTHTNYLDTMTLSARPAVVWDPEPGALYTLISYDVGYLRLKGIWVNIAGGDSSLGHELFPYHGPAHPIYSKTFQVFALFKQSGVIPEVRYQDIEDNVRSYMEQNKSIYLLSNLISVLNQIKDPMAIGLVATKTNPSAIGMAAQLNSINNCPYLLSRIPVLKKVMDVFNLTSRYNVFHDHRGDFFQDLEVDLEVQYQSDAVNFTSCCSEQMEPERLFQLDPISETPVKPVHLRNEPFLRFDAVNRMDKNFFFDKLFTVLLLDVTDASVNASSGTTPVLWMVTDIGGPYPSEGRTMVNYSMPMPAVSERRLYMFFVFRQPDPFPSNFSTSEYCMADGMTRCDFNIFKFVSMNNLHFSGISWVRSEEDYFSRMKLYENDASAMDSACAGLPHYGTPCPDPCAATPTPRPPTPRPRGSASVFFSMVTVVQVLALSLLVLVVVRE